MAAVDRPSPRPDKAAFRKLAMQRRSAGRDPALDAAANDRLVELIGPVAGRTVSGYMPIRSEISPLPAMAALCRTGTVCVPVVVGPRRPLDFCRWTPGAAMAEGAFGALIPAECQAVTPDILVLPLLAFDRTGNRMGYGGGFYDRTLAMLRRDRPVRAIGFAYACQQFDAVPVEPTDARLDAVVTEAETIVFD